MFLIAGRRLRPSVDRPAFPVRVRARLTDHPLRQARPRLLEGTRPLCVVRNRRRWRRRTALGAARQEEAAQAGIIPSLKRITESGSPLKQFALPILCDLASATKSCRTLLWQHNGLSLYLRLLHDPYFQVSALEAILSWYAIVS